MISSLAGIFDDDARGSDESELSVLCDVAISLGMQGGRGGRKHLSSAGFVLHCSHSVCPDPQ